MQRSSKRIGGEMPAFVDRLSAAKPWQDHWLPFSHGRAALGWLADRVGAKSAVVCAYTCKSVPDFLRSRNLAIGHFDVGADIDAILARAQTLPGPRLVLIPALFGAAPWVNFPTSDQAATLETVMVIDAAQTAFGHIDFAPPPGGATLSCPRKTTSLPDGAVLSVNEAIGAVSDTNDLQPAESTLALKAAARALWATYDPAMETEALELHRRSEAEWPLSPHRMSHHSLALLSQMDNQWHRETRAGNASILVRNLESRLPVFANAETPYSVPVFVEHQSQVLKHLWDQRIFATALWPDAQYDPADHPAAAWIARHLISLPIDQRHQPDDMDYIAQTVLRVAQAPSARPPSSLSNFLS